MSRVQQRVLRAVRLLPQAVKIGLAEPERLPPETEQLENLLNLESRETLSENKNKTEELKAQEPKAKPKPEKPAGPDPKLFAELEEQVKKLESELHSSEARISELEQVKAERDQLASEIEGIKSDYESRKKALEANAEAQAQKVAEEARQQAHDEGWNSGHTDGLKTARFEIEKEYHDKFAGLVKSLEGINSRLNEDFDKLVALNQPRLLRLWSGMLQKMLHQRVALDPTALDNVLTDLLSQLSDKSQIVIYAAPEDITRLEGEGGMNERVQEILRGVRHFELKPDPNVELGSCIVETALGVYDARWRTQLQQVDMVLDGIFQQINKDKREKS